LASRLASGPPSSSPFGRYKGEGGRRDINQGIIPRKK